MVFDRTLAWRKLYIYCLGDDTWIFPDYLSMAKEAKKDVPQNSRD
jgi:hypothetical protein